MSQLAFSIIIPTFHRNDLLAHCLDRLAPGVQTIPRDLYEVIVTDDGTQSTAQSLIETRYPWAKWVQGPRRGPAANRNNGASKATGKWLVFTDDDVLPATNWLEAFMTAAADGHEVYEGKTTCVDGVPSPNHHSPHNYNGGWLWSCNFMIDRHLFEKMDGFDERYPYAHMEDADLRERLKALGTDFPFVVNAIVDHPPRRRPSGARLARFHECEMIFSQKWGHPCPTTLAYTYRIAKDRLRTLRKYRLSWDWILAAASAFVELSVLATKYHGWARKYYGSAVNERLADVELATGRAPT